MHLGAYLFAPTNVVVASLRWSGQRGDSGLDRAGSTQDPANGFRRISIPRTLLNNVGYPEMHGREGRHDRSRPYLSLAARILIGALIGVFLGLLEIWSFEFDLPTSWPPSRRARRREPTCRVPRWSRARCLPPLRRRQPRTGSERATQALWPSRRRRMPPPVTLFSAPPR
jgi:hypothetical protein